MLRTTAGRLALNDALPEDMQSESDTYDGPGTQGLLQKLAEKHPEEYKNVLHKLVQLGHKVAFWSGGYSFDLKHMSPSVEAEKMKTGIKANIQQIYNNPGISDTDKEHQVVELLNNSQKPMEDAIYKESLAEKNPLAHQIQSGARGKKVNLKSLRGGDLMYVDHKDRPIPIPIMRSYAQGLTPVEYFAGSFGARKGVVDLKMGVPDAGFLGKQMVQAAHRLVVTKHDHEDPNFHKHQGMPVDTNDPDNEGSLLAIPAGGYERNAVLNPKVLSDLQSRGIKRIAVRSPIASGPVDGGVYGRDVGIRERGGISPAGDFVGIAAANALCLASGTEVRMADSSVKKIEDIVIGDTVLGCSIKGVLRPVKVINKYDNGIKSVYETKFRLGAGASKNILTLNSTLEHKFLSVFVKGHDELRRPAAEIRQIRNVYSSHDFFYAQLPSSYDDTGLGDYEEEQYALALGLLIGDGCYTKPVKNGSIGFSCYDEILVKDVEAYFHTIGCRLSPKSEFGEYLVAALNNGKCIQGKTVTGIRNPIKKILVNLNLWGQYSYQKTLPNTWHWSNYSVSRLIAGLIATDGYVSVQSNNRITIGYGSTSLALMEELKLILAIRFGIYTSSIASSRKKKKGTNDRYRSGYAIVITSYQAVKKFANIVSVPGIKGRILPDAINCWICSNKQLENGRCAFISQTPIGDRQTFDIEVENEDHLFLLANGLVVSNSEPVSQSTIGSKHTGGIAGASKVSQGFPLISQLIQVPRTFKGGATHAQLDGRVSSIDPAPQGGTYINIGGEKHYVPAGHQPHVQRADVVEAGDVLSEGIPNPSEIVKHKGIGEGKRYFVDTFRRAFRDSGLPAHRRNIELMARALIDHVRMTDEHGEHLPDDVVQYSRLEHSYQPREGHKVGKPKEMMNHYLEKPTLHYSIGTKIKPSVVKNLDEFGINEVTAHKDPPPFQPEMVRGLDNLSSDPDVFTRFLGSYQEKNLLKGVHRGGISDEAGTSYVPSLMKGTEFGKTPPIEPFKSKNILRG